MKEFTIVVSLILIATAASAQAQPISDTDWPTKGKDYGRNYFVPDELPLDNGQLNLKWKRFLGERIEVEMEPLVVGNLLYVGLMNGKFYALDKETGDTVWVYETGMGITDTPTIADVDSQLRIFFGSTNGVVYCLDALTGEELWTYQANGPIMSAPTFHGNSIFLGTIKNSFFALDADTGDLDWEYETSGPVSATSALGEISPGQFAVFVSGGDNVAYGFWTNGTLLWSNQMYGTFTKRTTVVFGKGSAGKPVVMFMTRKAGGDYSEYMNIQPAALDTYPTRQPGSLVISEWADWYQSYPRRRTLYYYDASAGTDLWETSADKTLYTSLYTPYWGLESPLVDDQGNAWFAASGGATAGLDHDTRLWRIDLETGEYTHAAHQADWQCRFDEVGRGTLIGDKYYQTISEDIGNFDPDTNSTNCNIFGNGFGNHRRPMEFDEFLLPPQGTGEASEIFGGMHKYFTRFAVSGPGYGGAVDAPSPLVVQDNEAYYTTWGHVYALTSQPTTPDKDYGIADLVQEPTTSMTRAEAEAELNNRIQGIVTADEHLGPVSREWGWQGSAGDVFWHHGEVVRTLSEAIPYVDEPLRTQLINYLRNEINDYILNNSYYQYVRGCVNYDQGEVQYECDTSGIYQGWYWSNNYLRLENLYSLYKYANHSGDITTISDNWDFIRGKYDGLVGNSNNNWNYEAGFFLFRDWHDGHFKPNIQMAGILGVREMARMVGDTETEQDADYYLSRMKEQRVYWGKYVRNLYDDGTLQRDDLDDWEDWGYDQNIAPIPQEGYLDQDNDYRQVHSLDSDNDGTLGPVSYTSTSFRYRIYPYRLIGYHPVYPEFAELYRDNLSDELMDYITASEILCAWWYMNDYSHCHVYGGHEEDSGTPLFTSDVFQAKAYIYEESFEELAPYLPWELEDYGDQDIFRIQNLVALLQATDESQPCTDCFHEADTSEPFGCIDIGELTAFINRWFADSQDVSMPELIGAVTLWRAGTGCI